MALYELALLIDRFFRQLIYELALLIDRFFRQFPLVKKWCFAYWLGGFIPPSPFSGLTTIFFRLNN